MDRTRRPEDDIPHPSPSDQAISKSTIIPQGKTKLTDIGSHQTTSTPALQGGSSYGPSVSTARTNAFLYKHLDSAAGAVLMIDSGQPSRSEPHPTDNQIAVIPVAPSSGFQNKMERGDTNQFDIERARAGQVSPCIGVVLPSSSSPALCHSFPLM